MNSSAIAAPDFRVVDLPCSPEHAAHLAAHRASLVARGTLPLDGGTDEEKAIVASVNARKCEQGR